MEQKTPHKVRELLRAMREWMALEDKTIENADELAEKTDNPFIRMTMEMLKLDAQKHKIIQQMVIDSLTKEAVHLSPEELVPLEVILNKHILQETESLMRAVGVVDRSESRITRYLLSYLSADEAGHRELVAKLNELKLAAMQIS
jgi:hypothetical protein